MELEFERAVKTLDDHIEVLTQDLLFSIAEERRRERITQIISVKRESDKAVEERMKLVKIYSRPLVIPITHSYNKGHKRNGHIRS
jgi:hypothetical protein